MVKNLNITAIVQARVTSVRYPGKVLKKIKKKSLVEILYLRLKKSKYIKKIIFAIPKRKEEIKLKKLLTKKKINFFEGSKYDVLDRYYKCASKNNSDIIIRITGDCPIIDARLIDKGISLFLKKNNKFSILTNYLPPTFPNGVDFSIFTLDGLLHTWKKAGSNYEKEHVVPYMLKSKKFKKYVIKNKINYSDIRITVDEVEDLIVVRKVFDHFRNIYFGWEKVIKIWEEKREIFKYNKHLLRDEGSKMTYSQKIKRRKKFRKN